MVMFGREAGPSRPATLVPGGGNQTPRFGAPYPNPNPNPNSNPNPSVHSPPPPPPPRSPWVPEAVERVQSPPLALASASFASNRPQFNGAVRGPAAPVGIRLPPPASQNAHPAAKQSYAAVVTSRPIGSPYTWVKGQSPAGKDVSQINSGPAAVTSFTASRNAGTSFAANITRFHDPKTARLPIPNSSNQQIAGNPNQDPVQRNRLTVLNSDGSHIAGPPLSFQNNNFPQPVAPLSNEGQWPVVSQSWHKQPQVPGSRPTMSHHQDRTPIPYSDLYDSGNGLNNGAEGHYPNQSRGPVLPIIEFFQEGTQNGRSESKRHSVSPPTWDSQSTSVSAASDAFIPPSSVRSGTVDEAGSSRSSNLPVAKRARSPPMTAADEEVIPGKLNSIADSTERETQAKAKRLARFRKELHEDTEAGANPAGETLSMSRHEFSKVEKLKNSGDLLMESAEEVMNGDTVTNLGSSEAPNIIMGLCPDMCPESERAERERKGDLDQYERVDGDRNQTNSFLAVKKYTRTAEREATLIRPMPVLQKTIEYLLNLLDQPYDERLLGMYNFLWDRMRGIRMDLRMQHLFNEKAITMLEQMIRLHIVAMHELCEYTKGEGFSEGFDAHLNIEQMNKTSVELFQLYDDHRKRGINIPTEKEFRGYYALLKLDKHPGYKVEPAELSLDLAKMTPEIRQTPEVLFARDVARGCRTGNFIAFFRLARKASYLQACLMHAHFAKLRTLALAALHSGLQTNQGLPVTLVAKWLAMEDEDVESLLEYHGFCIKDFEEPYMVKEGLFLNSDKDYTTRCSKLVQLKRSRRIVDDISPTFEAFPLGSELTKEAQLPKVKKRGRADVPPEVGKKHSPSVEEEMPDVKYTTFREVSLSIPLPMNQSKIVQRSPRGLMPAGATTPFSFISVAVPKPNTPKERPLEKPKQDSIFAVPQDTKLLWGMELAASPIIPRTAPDVISPSRNRTGVSPTTPKTVFHQISPTSVDDSLHGVQVAKPITGDEIVTNSNIQDTHFMDEDECNNTMQDEDDEVALAKLRLIIRLWKRRASKLKELREQRQVATEAALSALTLGPQFLHSRDRLQHRSATEFDIDRVMRERYVKHQKSWSRLNISDVVGYTLCQRNPHAECLFLKIVLCSQLHDQEEGELHSDQIKNMSVGSWLKSKLMPSTVEDDDEELLVSSPAVSIWKKWFPGQSGNNKTCCFSLVKDAKFSRMTETVAGAGGVLFVVSENIPWNFQKAQLHNLLMSIPSGASLPLLVLTCSSDKEYSDTASIAVNELGLSDLDKSRVHSFLVVPITGDEQVEGVDGFFSDKNLREGLRWLASESPIQPDLLSLKTRDLVMSHLNPLLDVLESRSHFELVPGHCISVFNDALDLTHRKISAAADANRAGWPCPEISLLQDTVVASHLPSVGWSSPEIINLLLHAVRTCNLPSFPDTGNQFEVGTNKHGGIEDLKLQLESHLIKYLAETCGMMGFQFAAKEARVMVQRSTRLELHGSTYNLTPNWILVFRRIFNWRLMNLSSGPFSFAYVSRDDCIDLISRDFDRTSPQGNDYASYLSRPSLDDMIKVGCSPLPFGRELQPEANRPLVITRSDGDIQVAADVGDMMQNEVTRCLDSINPDSIQRGRNTKDTEMVLASKPTKEADRLSKLIEQCNIVQNAIDKKLQIYF